MLVNSSRESSVPRSFDQLRREYNGGEPFGGSGSEMKVLSLSCTYPNPTDPLHGTFVRSRLVKLARLVHLKVVAPVALLDYANVRTKFMPARGVPYSRLDGSIEVMHPRWLFPPGGTPVTPLCLFLRLLFPIGRIREEFRFDLIDAHFAFPDGVAAALLSAVFDCPYSVTLRGNEVMFSQNLLRRYCMRWALRRADCVITVSERLREFAASLGVPAERTKVVPNGVESGIFFPRGRSESRRKYQIPIDDRVILSAGHLIELKGHHRVLHALRALSDRGIRSRVVVVGKGGGEYRYEQYIRQLTVDLDLESQVKFMGQVSQETLAELMSAADVFCLASSREGWPNVVHEALACGTPVVATDVGGIPDLLPSNEYGFVVPINDQSALIKALMRVFEQQWDRNAISAWAHSRSWEQAAREVVEAMRIVLRRRCADRQRNAN